MLFLLFQLGDDRYALDASLAIEVVPFVELMWLPRAPRGVAGIFNYRGQPVAAVDLCELILGRPARELLSTRIIVVNLSALEPPERSAELQLYTSPNLAEQELRAPRRCVGLVVEHATGLMRREATAFVNSGLKSDRVPRLGPIAMDAQGVIQLLQTEHLFPQTLSDAILHEALHSRSEAG